MIEVNPLKRRAAAFLDWTGLTALSFALQRSVLSPFIRVVYYHDVPAGMREAFAAQLAALKGKFVPASKADLARLLAEGHWPHDKPGIIVTFDDGLRSHSEVVAPILEQLGFEGWFFVPIDLVSTDPVQQPAAAVRHGVIHYCDTSRDPRVFMTEQQLVYLSQRHNIGCHTATHLRLSREITAARLDLEIDRAQQRLEAVVRRPVDSFSWVGGEEWAYSRAAAERIASRFEYVFTTNTCVTRAGSSRLAIDRTHLEAPFCASLVRLQLSGMMDLYYGPKRRRLDSRLAAARPGAAAAATQGGRPGPMYDHKQSVKEVLRHALFRCGLSDTLDVVRNWRGLHTRHVREPDMAGIFSRIYSTGAWVMRENQDSLSGVGSAQVATGELTAQLSAFLREVGCRRLVDIGCGDFNWMRGVEGDFDYLGIDVVPEVVAENNARYANDRRRFLCTDATAAPLDSGDVAVCREVLFHLSFADGRRLLRNIKAAGFDHVLFTNDKSIWFNSDIRSGDFRRLNLLKAPFGFPASRRELTDDKVSFGRVLAAWPASALPV